MVALYAAITKKAAGAVADVKFYDNVIFARRYYYQNGPGLQKVPGSCRQGNDKPSGLTAGIAENIKKEINHG